jgi:hypothetical protein
MPSPTPRRRPSLPLVLLLTLPLAAGLPSAAPAQDDTGDEVGARAEEVVERIHRLQEEIETLLRDLSPEVRREVERRLTGLPGAEPEVAYVEPGPAPAPGPAGCAPLGAFDSDGDGLVSARDRYWRYLLLVRDANGDREPQRSEAVDLYEAGVRSLDATLTGFRLAEGGRGRIDVDSRITLDFGDTARPDAWLAVDASRLARGAGPALLPREGDQPLTDLQLLQPGQWLRYEDGRMETVGGCF